MSFIKNAMFLVILVSSNSYATELETRNLDDRCDGHAKYVIKLLKNKYEGETLEEQLDLVNEWSDPVYRKEIQLVLKEIVYKLPVVTNEKDLVIQTLENYIGAYRGCIQLRS